MYIYIHVHDAIYLYIIMSKRRGWLHVKLNCLCHQPKVPTLDLTLLRCLVLLIFIYNINYITHMILPNQTYKCYSHRLPLLVHRTFSWWSKWPVQIIAQAIQGEGLNVHCRVEQLRKIDIRQSILQQETKMCVKISHFIYTCRRCHSLHVHPKITIITIVEKNFKKYYIQIFRIVSIHMYILMMFCK